MMSMETGFYQSKEEAKKNVLEFKIEGLEEAIEGLRNRIEAISNDNLKIPLEKQLEIKIDDLRKLENELGQLERQIEEAENSNNTVH